MEKENVTMDTPDKQSSKESADESLDIRDQPAAKGQINEAPSLNAIPPKENRSDPVAPPFQKNIERILDIDLPVVLHFGETSMLLKDVLQLSTGSIIQLDKSADDPVNLMVNRKLIARGQLVVVDGNYGIKITDVESTAERIRSLA